MRDRHGPPTPDRRSDPPGVRRVDRARVEYGRWGEDLVARHYRRAGYEIVDRNWRCRAGEIDLVVGRPGLVVVCEVKTRRSAAYGGGAAAVDARKQRRLRRLAAAWLAAHDVGVVDVRFDVAVVTGVRLDLIESAF